MFHYDLTYLLYIVLPVMALALVVQLILWGTYQWYSGIQSKSGLTGAEAARWILDLGGVRGVAVHEVSGFSTDHGFLWDHYAPHDQALRLSPQNFEGRSIAALGVAAHEAGHALQHAQAYKPLAIRSVAVPAANIGTTLAYMAFFIGLLTQFWPLALVGFVFLCGILVFQLINLPVEFDASRRALQLLPQSEILTVEENRGAQKVLAAAALTHVAAMIAIPLELLNCLGSRRRFFRDD